jgi:hypothetical protein
MAVIAVREILGWTFRPSGGHRHAEVDGRAASGEVAHGLQLLASGGHGGLDRGDLAEPGSSGSQTHSEA